MKRREFIAALGSALGISLITSTRFPCTSDDSAPLVYDVTDLEWARLGIEGREAVNEFLHSHGVDPDSTYRVEFNRSPMHRATKVRVYAYHVKIYEEGYGPSLHSACDGSDSACRIPPYEVAL